MRTLGIILAGGHSTRLRPATLATTKQLLPIYDKPLVYYPLSTLMLLGIQDYVIITTPDDLPQFEKLFYNSKAELGINITFVTQLEPKGIPQAFELAQHFVDVAKYDRTALILGDNIFYGSYMSKVLRDLNSIVFKDTAGVVLKEVPSEDAVRFGIAFMDRGEIQLILEKPLINDGTPKLAVTGLYFYPPDVYDKVKALPVSDRGETEITDLNNLYIKEDRISYTKLLRGMVWFDTGTPDSMLDAANLVRAMQDQGIMIGNIHEIAFSNKWIQRSRLNNMCAKHQNTKYGKYLFALWKKAMDDYSNNED